ncbi:hypothetical protein DVH05_017463 [Phytophthora capsici]|nr:hypothetical protein DVH05_017463 [Phytophthora capsici]
MDITELLNAVDNSTSDWEIDEDEADLAVEGLDEEEEEVDSGEEAQPAPALNEESQPGPTPARRTGNVYVDNLIQDSGLPIVREREVMLAYRQRQELGLFSLFFYT